MILSTITPMDWSATAAWIALAISIVGTIASPLITTWLTNRHQLKMRKLKITQQEREAYVQNRLKTINGFLSEVGGCIFYRGSTKADILRSYHSVYQYVPVSEWKKLDELYVTIFNFEWDKANTLYPPIVHLLSEILKAEPQKNP